MSQATVATTRDRHGNWVHTLTCSRCKTERMLYTDREKPPEPFVCFSCWKVERGLP